MVFCCFYFNHDLWYHRCNLLAEVLKEFSILFPFSVISFLFNPSLPTIVLSRIFSKNDHCALPVYTIFLLRSFLLICFASMGTGGRVQKYESKESGFKSFRKLCFLSLLQRTTKFGPLRQERI